MLFFFNDTATTEIYTLSLHDALPIYRRRPDRGGAQRRGVPPGGRAHRRGPPAARPGGTPVMIRRPDHHGSWLRSEEHTSELQSRQYIVCRLLLEKKKISTKTLLSSRA